MGVPEKVSGGHTPAPTKAQLPKSLSCLQRPCLWGVSMRPLFWALPQSPYIPHIHSGHISCLLILSFKRPCPASVKGELFLLQCPLPLNLKGARELGEQVRVVAGAAHIFIQVRLLQIHDPELQPLEDLLQGLAGLVVELLTWDEMECTSVRARMLGGLAGNGGSGGREGSLHPPPLREGTHTSQEPHCPGLTCSYSRTCRPRPTSRGSGPAHSPGVPASVPTRTFQVQTINAVSKVRELLGKQGGQG